MPVRCLLLLLLVRELVSAQPVVPPAMLPNPAERLTQYRANLAELRQLYSTAVALPDLRFFLFGMGNRTKYVYRAGRLLDAFTGHIEEQWRVRQELIVPPDYLVHLHLDDGRTVQIREDEAGVWLLETGRKPRLLTGTKAPLRLPAFADRQFGPVLRVLHQEVLINVVGAPNRPGRPHPAWPLPNLLVYQRPAYRSAAMMAMVLRQTGNLPLIRDWIIALRGPFGQTNADNWGQILFMVSLVADKTHPAVAAVLDSVRVLQNGGTSSAVDETNHPVFRAKWLKFGLRSLGLPDPYVIPDQTDLYASVFWPDYRQTPEGRLRFDVTTSHNQPYLSWAAEHFYVLNGQPMRQAPLGTLDYPLSWERNAPSAHYPGLTVLDKGLAGQKLAFPHGWQAAEMFLLLSEL